MISSGPVERHRQKKSRTPIIMMLLCRPYKLSLKFRMSVLQLNRFSEVVSRDIMGLVGLI